MLLIISLFMCLFVSIGELSQISQLVERLNHTLEFVGHYYDEINFDGLLGVVITEARLLNSLDLIHPHSRLIPKLHWFLDTCNNIRQRIQVLVPLNSPKMVIFSRYLLKPRNWITLNTFEDSRLANLGLYWNWTESTITEDKRAVYKGVPSDYCILQILENNCRLNEFCQDMMLSDRLDTGYLLSHRLFFLQIARIKGCHLDLNYYKHLTIKLCSLMLKEAKTNDYLDFPSYDIFLEQMVLCGTEGFSEFLNTHWREQIMEWQTNAGCYQPTKTQMDLKRSSNIIAFGCSDHTTGLGAAALALNLQYVLYNARYSEQTIS